MSCLANSCIFTPKTTELGPTQARLVRFPSCGLEPVTQGSDEPCHTLPRLAPERSAALITAVLVMLPDPSMGTGGSEILLPPSLDAETTRR